MQPEKNKQKLIKIRRQIHQYPELGNEEFKTTALIEKELHSAGIQTKRITKTGIIGLIKSKSDGICVGLRGDIDALPVQEQTGKPYASRVANKMHACGHDANATIVLGTALLLAKKIKSISGQIKFVFQPNEESAGGALSLIQNGVMENPKIHTMFGVHVNPVIPIGKIGVRYGAMFAAPDRFKLKIIGEGGHAASPHKSKDAIIIATQVVQALQTIVSRRIDPVEPVVITIGTIHGGERFNIIAGEVELTGTVRTLNESVHKQVPKLIIQTIKNICQSWDAEYKLDYESLGSPLVNSDEIVAFVEQTAKELVGEKNVIRVANPSMGGEDFAEFLRYAPGCFLYIGSSNKNKETQYPWHHPKFDLDETALPFATQVLSEIIQRYLQQHKK